MINYVAEACMYCNLTKRITVKSIVEKKGAWNEATNRERMQTDKRWRSLLLLTTSCPKPFLPDCFILTRHQHLLIPHHLALCPLQVFFRWVFFVAPSTTCSVPTEFVHFGHERKKKSLPTRVRKDYINR